MGRFGLVNIDNVPQEDSLSVMDFQVLDDYLIHGLVLRCRILREKPKFYGLQVGNLGMCRAVVNDEGYFPVLLIHLLVGFTRDMKISDVIQAFMLALYWTGRDLTFLKHRGLTALPMTSMGSLSLPSMFEHVISVSLSLFFLPP